MAISDEDKRISEENKAYRRAMGYQRVAAENSRIRNQFYEVSPTVLKYMEDKIKNMPINSVEDRAKKLRFETALEVVKYLMLEDPEFVGPEREGREGGRSVLTRISTLVDSVAEIDLNVEGREPKIENAKEIIGQAEEIHKIVEVSRTQIFSIIYGHGKQSDKQSGQQEIEPWLEGVPMSEMVLPLVSFLANIVHDKDMVNGPIGENLTTSQARDLDRMFERLTIYEIYQTEEARIRNGQRDNGSAYLRREKTRDKQMGEVLKGMHVKDLEMESMPGM